MLLLASWIFYGAWDGRFVLLLIASAVLNWGVGRLVLADQVRARGWLIAGVLANLALLGFFKYYGFFATELRDLLGALNIPVEIKVLDIILPVGISFFTFQGISYIVDVWKGRSEPARLLELTFLMSFFPIWLPGPSCGRAISCRNCARDPGSAGGRRRPVWC
jgi:D-alanyl-lipoteichoic acid acyltransferase DltB (MBOAT superfamily)